MFNLTSDLLKSILSLQNADETRGSWIVFIRELEKIRDQHVSESLHYVPSWKDQNAQSRGELFRGIAVCLDVLTNALKDPMTILESREKTEKQQERIPGSSLF